MLTYSLGQEACPAGYQYDPIEQQCVPIEMASLTALRVDAVAPAATAPASFAPTASIAPVATASIAPTATASMPLTPTAPSVPIDPYAPVAPVAPSVPIDPYAPVAPVAPADLIIPPAITHPAAPDAGEERTGWKWWYWLLLAGGVGGTGALLYYGLARPTSTGLRGSDPVRIKIVYGARKTANGWKPMYWLNGRSQGIPWHGEFDKGEAIRLAKIDALRHADHYSGDRDVTVRKRR